MQPAVPTPDVLGGSWQRIIIAKMCSETTCLFMFLSIHTGGCRTDEACDLSQESGPCEQLVCVTKQPQSADVGDFFKNVHELSNVLTAACLLSRCLNCHNLCKCNECGFRALHVVPKQMCVLTTRVLLECVLAMNRVLL